MASNGTILPTNFTLRQQEIVAGAAKQLNIPYSNINSAVIRDDLPETINVFSDKGNYSTSVIPLYGDLLNPTEKAQLIENRLQSANAQQSLESLNGVSDLLGKNKQPFVSSAGTDRVKAETVPTSTFDPSEARRANAGLPAGAQNSSGNTGSPLVKFNAPNGDDTRVRIVVPINGPRFLTQGPVLSALANTNGVLFPYTPSISISHGAQYSVENLTHSNYSYQFYQSSNVESITINATFACKNGVDAEYVVAAQHFFRTVTKMFYGTDAEAGVPPPVLRLEGHGAYQFGSHTMGKAGGVPIVITNFAVTLPEDVDYITTTSDEKYSTTTAQTRVPVVQQFSITCSPLYSRKSVSQEFGLKKFANGELLATPARGGFI